MLYSIVVSVLGMVMDVRFSQEANALYPMVSTVLGNTMLSIAVERNAISPIFTMPSGNVTAFKLEQFINKLPLISVKPNGSSISVKDVHFWNACSPMLFIFPSNVTLLRFVQERKTPSSISFTELGMVTDSSVVLLPKALYLIVVIL